MKLNNQAKGRKPTWKAERHKSGVFYIRHNGFIRFRSLLGFSEERPLEAELSARNIAKAMNMHEDLVNALAIARWIIERHEARIRQDETPPDMVESQSLSSDLKFIDETLRRVEEK